MIKYLMRKTIYKKYDIESQDMLFQLTLNRHLLEILCLSFWVFIYIFSFIPVIIIVISEKIEFSILTNITLIIYFLLYFMGYILLLIVFPRAMFSFTHLLAQKLFFLIYTKKGKAITKKDFSKIKHIKEELYLFIETQMCKGYCYSICFEICKVLKKGYIEFLAIKEVRINGEDEDNEKDFTMHVLFVNNGWAFDTFSCLQFPLEELHKIYKAKIYKSFSFEEICNESYEDFREVQEPDLAKWASDNNCSLFWKSEQ